MMLLMIAVVIHDIRELAVEHLDTPRAVEQSNGRVIGIREVLRTSNC